MSAGRFVGWCGVGAAVVACAAGASCGGGDEASTSGDAVTSGAGGSSGAFTTAGGGGAGEGGSCLAVTGEAKVVVAPIDVVLVIDNSASMTAEIQGVIDHVNQDFGDVLTASKIDYRVIAVSAFGSVETQGLCVAPPLGANLDCKALDPKTSKPQQVPGKFAHYDWKIESKTAWCDVLKTLTGDVAVKNGHRGPTDFPKGWGAELRPDAFKMVVLFTDDRIVECDDGAGPAYGHKGDDPAEATAVAATMDAHLRGRAPAQFGAVDSARNYRFHFLGGLAASEVLGPEEPLVTTKNAQAYNEGLAYQALAKLTGGLRYAVNDTAGYATVFKAVAEEIEKQVAAPCTYALDPPASMPELVLDEGSVQVSVTLGGGATKKLSVAAPGACSVDGFVVEGTLVKLCPQACAAVSDDPKAKVSVSAGCWEEVK